jgi:two-component sensor histidine kinase
MLALRNFIRWLPTVKSGSWSAYAVAWAAAILGTLFRFGVGALFGQTAVPYATYYPAVLIASIIGGGRSGVLTMMLGAVAGYLLFSPSTPLPPTVPHGGLPDVPIVSAVLYFLSCGLIIAFATVYRMAVAELVQERDRVTMLSGELQHRIKNMGAVVQAVVSRTLGPQHPATETLKRRIAVLIANHVKLDGNTQSGSIRAIVDAELGVHGNTRVQRTGIDAALENQAALCLTMALHELATNALKYGALSVESGHLSVTWQKQPDGTAFWWVESGGPTVRAPDKLGFGTTLLKNILEEQGGHITLDFKPEGLTAHFILPDLTARKAA